MTSLECAPGAIYDLPDPGTATYDNPLASLGMPPDVPKRHDSLYDKPRVMAQYETSSSPMAQQGSLHVYLFIFIQKVQFNIS